MEEFSEEHIERADRMAVLLSMYLGKGLSSEEQQEMERLFSRPPYKQLLERLQDPQAREAYLKAYNDSTPPEAAHRRFVGTHYIQTVRAPRRTISYLPRFAAAAVIAGLLAAAGWYYAVHRPQDAPPPALARTPKVGEPGSDKAVLTLSNGTRVALGATVASVTDALKKDGVRTNDKGLLAYSGAVDASLDPEAYNTLVTPLGGQYQVRLPDGSKVWLNAGSTLQYPVSFAGKKQRIVALTGEGYFEIAENKSQPFSVITPREVVHILGTHFNVMAYPDERNVETTLLQGAVAISHQGSETTLQQGGQQARLSKDGSMTVASVDAIDYIAWKNGLIRLRHADIPTVMRQISRWYNVGITYDLHGKALPSWTLAGTVPRTLSLSDVLRVLALNGIHCNLSNDNAPTIVVTL